MANSIDRRALAARLGDHRPQLIDDGTLARAAVAAVFSEGRDDLEVLLIRRAEDERDPWSGHIAFPGGRSEPSDSDLEQTAIRETLEELGLDLALARRLGRLDDVQAVARARRIPLVIAPFIFWLDERPPLAPNHEVAEAIWAPLTPMLTGRSSIEHPYVYGDRTVLLPGYAVEGHTVWGLTYQMLNALFRVLRD